MALVSRTRAGWQTWTRPLVIHRMGEPLHVAWS
jgi:hypothetical protein